MARLIVVPDRAWLEAGAERAGVGRAGHGVRRARLYALAASALPPGEARRRAERRAGGIDVGEGEGYAVLEGLGVLLVDEAVLDRETLRRRTGALVVPNVTIARVASVEVGREASGQGQAHPFWHLETIGVASLWDQGMKGAGVTVGVLDSGIQASHPEFEGKTVHFGAFDEEGNLTSVVPKDFGQHGTHVAGVIGGRRAGVAPEATLAVAAVLTARGKGHLAQVLGGLNWLLTTAFGGEEDEVGCDVLNAALEIPGYAAVFYAPLAAAVRCPGMLTVAAVGNFGTRSAGRLASPGNYDVVVGVGATDRADRVAAFSQHGTVEQHGGRAKPDLCAPGVEIWSSVPYGQYTPQSGTSMASPLVAGTAALLVQQEPALRRNVPALTEALLANVVPLPEQGPRAGYGRLCLREGARRVRSREAGEAERGR
ncbi:S8 family peptidase [Chondromyces crocatus]|uniref:Peptidase S8/S53 domain-containing protein n=1 Tax=Chondromyces crocatus TaxID=52 RepID=A0A0K1EE87_CHOCO|nr:S8 family serine peptidase [Chondromyces crocatus]AKT39181.1 uncharacterized protein CMC5_033280 [Chondromyces crocatus]